MAAAKKGGLGRGLDALFADAVPVYDEAGAVKAQAKDTEKKGKAEHTAGEKSENDGVRYIKIHDIMPNLNQPRKTFQEDKIEELAASIKECMKTTPVDRITVKDIVEGSGLTRQTFYRNFKDKYDLINWYFDKLVLQSFEQIGMGNTVGESLTQKFEFILNEKAFFTEAFRSDDYNSVKEHDFELILQFYKDLIARKTSRPLGEELEFLLEMYCRGSVYMTEKWVLGGMKDSPRRMSDKLVEAMPPKLEKVFSELELL